MFGINKKPRKQKKETGTFRIGDLYPNYTHSALWSSWAAREAVRDGYENSVYVYACVRLRATSVSSVPIIASKDGESIDNAEILKLLQNPNPEMSESDLLEFIMGNLDTSGNAYFKIVKSGNGKPLELWPLDADKIEPCRSKNADKFITHYSFDGGKKVFHEDEILHLKFNHPLDRMKGMSPLKPAGMSVDIDNEANTWQKISMQNRGVPDGVFTLEGEIGADEYEEAKRQVKAEYSGSSNAREPWVVANAKFQQISLNPAELDFINSRKMTRSEICTAFQVPEPMVGIFENATLSNIETAKEIFWKDVVTPLLSLIKRQLNSKLQPMFGINSPLLSFDVSNVPALQESFSDKLDAAKKLHELGVPLTEINERLELNLDTDNIPGADVGYIASGKIPTDFDFESSNTFASGEKMDIKTLYELAYGKNRKG